MEETAIRELEKMFDEHRKKAKVCCDKYCFCWDVEPIFHNQKNRQ